MFSGTMPIEEKPGCVEAAARILGDKWTPLMIKALAAQPLRFCELQKAAGGINPRTLSARLNTLEQHCIIAKSLQSGSTIYAHYALTKKGFDLVPVLKSMAIWGDKYGSIIEASANSRVAQDASVRS